VDPGAHGLRVSGLDVGIVGLAAAMAEAADGSVRVVHCVREPPLGLEIRPAIRRRERQRVQTMIRHLARGAGLAHRDARLLDGAPVDTLIDAVNEEDADILVMGTVVRGPVRQLLIGSTTEQLIHAAPCDLLLVKPDSARIGTRR
jgi:universal stress protein E